MFSGGDADFLEKGWRLDGHFLPVRKRASVLRRTRVNLLRMRLRIMGAGNTGRGVFAAILAMVLAGPTFAALRLPSIIGDRMVLQQKQENPVWGWDDPGTRVTVTFGDQKKVGVAGPDGRWTVRLDGEVANAVPRTMLVSGTTSREVKDVLIGEVWMCSGQSNMGFQVGGDFKGDIEAAASNLPNLRLIRVPNRGTQELQEDFNGEWRASSPETAKPFSAVGFFFGRYLHQILGVPVGLIDNSWGGSAAEAWVRRGTIDQDPRFAELIRGWREKEAFLESVAAKEKHEKELAEWKEYAEKAKGTLKPGQVLRRQPQPPQQVLTGNQRPGNIFAGVLNPTLGYGIKGVIWYQGESNASRAWEYRELFPMMIQEWRKEWKQGDFPFYWAQLADFKEEKVSGESDWAELREAQTLAMRLPNSGQAVITDLGEGRDIHPRNKYDVAGRLVRWALVKDYGMKFVHRSPELKECTFDGGKARVTLELFGSKLRPFDVLEARGFVLCGEDRVWRVAKGEIVDLAQGIIEVASPEVAKPIAVRYAWADNPVCNLFNEQGLPVTPFRSDNFEMITKPKAASGK